MNNSVNYQLVQPAGVFSPGVRFTDTYQPHVPITQAAAGSPAANYVSLERTFRGAMRGVTTGAR